MMALTHPGPESNMVAYLLDRDRRIRVQARMLYLPKERWPWGEASREAREKLCAVLWTIADVNHKRTPAAVLTHADSGDDASDAPRRSGGKRPRTNAPRIEGSNDKGQRSSKWVRSDPHTNRTFCSAFQTAKGCVALQRECPEKGRHACNLDKGDGKPCNNHLHGRSTCPRAH